MPPDSNSVLTKFYLKPDVVPVEKTQRNSNTILKRNGKILHDFSPTFQDLQRVQSENLLNEVKSDSASTRRLIKRSYELAAKSLCDPLKSFFFPQRFRQEQFPFKDDDPEFDFWDATSHLIEKNDAGLTATSSLEDHEPYVLTEDELDFLEASEPDDSTPEEEEDLFIQRTRWVEDISKPKYPHCGWSQEEVVGWSINPPENISSYQRRWVKYPQKKEYPYCGWKKKTFRVLVDNPDFQKKPIEQNRLINPNDKKLIRRINCAERNTLRNQLLDDAHRVKAMLTITVVPRRKKFSEDSFNPTIINGEDVLTWEKARSVMIPNEDQRKCYLREKLNLLYKVLSELDQQIPFNQIPNADCAKFISVYEDRTKNKRGKIVWTMPHLHILILDDVSSLIDPDRLAVLLQRLSGKQSKQFDLPKIHLKFPTGGNAHQEWFIKHRIDEPPLDFMPLREQRIRMIPYVTKFMWQERSIADGRSGVRKETNMDDWKLMRSEDFQKQYFKQSESEAIQQDQDNQKQNWRRKRLRRKKNHGIKLQTP